MAQQAKGALLRSGDLVVHRWVPSAAPVDEGRHELVDLDGGGVGAVHLFEVREDGLVLPDIVLFVRFVVEDHVEEWVDAAAKNECEACGFADHSEQIYTLDFRRLNIFLPASAEPDRQRAICQRAGWQR